MRPAARSVLSSATSGSVKYSVVANADTFALATEFTALAGLGKRRLSAAETAKAPGRLQRPSLHTLGAECLRNENAEAAVRVGVEMRRVGQHLTHDLGIVDERTHRRQIYCPPQSRREVHDREGEWTVERVDQEFMPAGFVH